MMVLITVKLAIGSLFLLKSMVGHQSESAGFLNFHFRICKNICFLNGSPIVNHYSQLQGKLASASNDGLLNLVR